MASVNYGRCVIKTERKSVVWRARALRGNVVASPILEGAAEDDAISAVKAYLDAASAAERAQRAPDGYPTTARVKAALDAIRKTKAQSDMLGAHRDATDHVMSATQIAQAGGYASYSSSNSQYGKLARLLAEEMEYEPPRRPNGTTMWTYALAVDAEASALSDEDGHFRWRMRPEVVAALT